MFTWFATTIFFSLMILVILKRDHQRRIVICQSTVAATSLLRILVIKSWVQKYVGLLNHSALPEGAGILLWKTNTIHTRGMLFPIDVVGLNKKFEVTCIRENIPPEIAKVTFGKATEHIIETGAGVATQYFQVGMRIEAMDL